jgi:FKBP-type peptidyl-prolyl cis-trans isomerase FklB
MTRLLLAAAVIIAGAAWAQDKTPEPAKPAAAEKPADGIPADFATLKAKVNYIIGASTALNMTRQGIELEPEAFSRGVADAAAGKANLVPEQMQKIFMAYQEEIQKLLAGMKDGNEKKGDEFLKANAAKEGVKQLPSGIQYKVVKAAAKDAASPTLTDLVTCNYRGTLIDGTEFDSSYARKEPATFPVRGVIRGWTEVLQLMRVGDHWQVFIPAKLAYGDTGSLPKIQPGSALVFDIELLDVKPMPKQEGGMPGGLEDGPPEGE